MGLLHRGHGEERMSFSVSPCTFGGRWKAHLVDHDSDDTCQKQIEDKYVIMPIPTPPRTGARLSRNHNRIDCRLGRGGRLRITERWINTSRARNARLKQVNNG